MNISKVMRFALLGGTALSLISPIAASAQDGASEDDTEFGGTIIVTAQGREQNLQEVPVSVSVVGGEFLTENNINAIEDLAVRLPSVRLTTAPAANLLNIRGVGSGLNAGFEQSVGTFVDGVYRGRSRAAAATLFDVERVEVLKGPQSTFFGNNVVAGALNIATRKPSFNTEVNVSALYSPSDGEYSLEAGASLPLSDDLAVRLAGRIYGMDGFVENETSGEDAPRNRDAVGRFSLRWEPGDAWRTDLRIDHGRLRDQPATETDQCPPDAAFGGPSGSCAFYLAGFGGTPDDGVLNYRTTTVVNEFRYDFTEIAFTNSLDLGGVTLTSVTSYFDHSADTLTDADPLPLPGVGGTASRIIINTQEDVEQFSQELRLASDTGGAIEYILGAYYAKEELDVLQNVGLYFAPFFAIATGTPPGPPLWPNVTPTADRRTLTQEAETLSAFASVTFRPIEDLSIDISARYTDVSKEASRSLNYGTNGFIPSEAAFVPFSPMIQNALSGILGGTFNDFANPKYSDDKFLPSAKISYKVNPDVMVYASYSSGFKAGGFAIAPGAFEFEAETVDSYEVGIKADLAGGRVRTNLTAFLADYDNLQEATNTVNPLSGTLQSLVGNSASSRAKGLELSIDAELATGLRFRTDVAYLDAYYRSYPGGTCTILQSSTTPNCIQDLSGARRAYAPKWSGNVGMSYTGALTDDLDIRVDPLLYFSSKFFQSATADSLLAQDGYGASLLAQPRVGASLRVGRPMPRQVAEFRVV